MERSTINTSSAEVNNWSLFGFDLRNIGAFFRLGLEQLLFDQSSVLARRLAPSVAIWNIDGGFLGVFVGSALQVLDEKPTSNISHNAILLPNNDVLTKRILVPAVTETDLAGVIASEVYAASPFPPDFTRSGWAIQNREKGLIEVLIAITSSDVIERALECRREPDSEKTSTAEVWVIDGDGAPVVLPGFGESSRRRSVYRQFQNTLAVAVMLWLATMAAIFVPSLATSNRAGKLEQALFDVRGEAAAATRARSRLLLSSERLDTIKGALSERSNYAYWLQHIAKTAPDGVYFERVKLEGTEVEASGFADNAANYLRILTEQPDYSDVETGAAFVRNRRTELEMFTIKWRLIEDEVQ